MVFIHFFLLVYFSAVLGVAGIAKVDNTNIFISTLKYQYRFPAWSVRFVGKTFPWIEIGIAIAILGTTGINKFIASLLILGILIIFSFSHLIHHAKSEQQSTPDCGCYGRALQRREPNTNSIALLIQLVLAVLLVLITLAIKPLPEEYYVICMALFTLGYGYLLWRTWQRHHLIQ